MFWVDPHLYSLIYYVYIVMTPCYRSEENSTIGEVTYLHVYSNNEEVFGSMVSVDMYASKWNAL